jgi:TPP-dependent pyruvate/acetoin dehydrogenase alpha subunit
MSISRSERLQALYLQMCRIRCAEQAMERLWQDGRISGELHLGLGEEAVVAGVVGRLEPGDALALDYRSTPPLVARGVDLTALVAELIGSPEGLCGGRAGHMHLMSKEHLAAASGIVGAPGPLACGFGLSAWSERTGGVAVAFFGDGAVNEGMLMESLNLAAAWRLPVVFVCKDNRWAVTTRSAVLTGGGLRRRLAAFGMSVVAVDGRDVEKVDRAASRSLGRARAGQGPSVLLVRCARLDGHFVGDPAARLGSLLAAVRPLLDQVRVTPGAPVDERLRALGTVSRRGLAAAGERKRRLRDPLPRAASRLPAAVATALAAQARAEVEEAVERAVRIEVSHG